IETVKQAEDGNGIIVRMYETAGTRLKTRLTTGFAFSEAWSTDLMETNGGQLHPEDGKLALAFVPFEIKTLRLTAN
ncbi:hypothetical protein K0U00_23190, partial [Paenibacillus sepulcri]|nr:hypothetical protein [Paenibacillus sepulcri]